MIGTFALQHLRPKDVAAATPIFHALRDQFLKADPSHPALYDHFQTLSKAIQGALQKLPKPVQDSVYRDIDEHLVKPLLANAHHGDINQVKQQTIQAVDYLLKGLKLPHPLYPN